MNFSDTFSPGTLDKYPALHEFYSRVGSTPLIEVETPDGHGRIFAKCEWHNPAGTIKARVAMSMIWNLLSKIEVVPGETTVLEYSGGGLSVVLAQLCHKLSLRCKLVLIETTPKSLLKSLADLQAEVHLSKKELGFWGVMETAFELKKQNPDWHFLYQHENTANVIFHREVTAGEIISQLDGAPDAYVASIGTGGTLAGVYAGLKQKFPHVKVYATCPSEMPYGTEAPPNSLSKFAGSGGLGLGRKQKFVSVMEEEIQEHFLFSYAEAKAEMYRFYRETGMTIGSSAAANLMAAKELAKRLGEDSTIVTVFPSEAFDEEKAELIQKAEAEAGAVSI